MTKRPTRCSSLGRVAGLILAAAAHAACGNTYNSPTAPGGPEPPGPPAVGRSLAIHSGDDQLGEPGELLREPLVVRVTNRDGLPIEDVLVLWRVIEGGGAVPGPRVPIDGGPGDATETFTDRQGLARAVLELGPGPGPNTVEATTLFADSVTFRATAID